MNIEEELFKKAKIDFAKLVKYGFQKQNQEFVYQKDIMNSFKVNIRILKDGIVTGKIYDLNTSEEYTLFRANDNLGNFASKVKEEYIKILKEILTNCSESNLFLFNQTNRITNIIRDIYQIEPEFLWESTPGAGVFRNINSKKWFGIIMNVDKSKIAKNQTGEIEIINVKLADDMVQNLLQKRGFYPAYHMNKKSWITIILDDTLKDEEVIKYVKMSYENTK